MTLVPVHERFSRWAAETPAATALVSGGQRLTYAELDQRAKAVAALLRASGVAQRQLVGVSALRDFDLIVSILGVLKAGAAYVPLDPSYPKHRLDALIADSQLDTIVTVSRLADRMGHPGVELILADTRTEQSDRRPPTPSGDWSQLDDPAYVMYTSGSTGDPNGVVVSHRNVARLFNSTRRWFTFGPADVWTLFHSYAFDFSVWEMWGALAHGGTLAIVPHGVSRSPQLFRQLVHELGVTVLNQTPSAFYQFIQADLVHGSTDELALRYVIFGGEALEFASLTPWIDRHGDQKPQLINMYGITETTVHVTYRPVTAQDVARERASLIGVPIPDLSLHVLGPERQPVAADTVGELYVGGAGVSLGYLNRPELTRERFIPDPFDPVSSQPLYKTGDLVRKRANGDLEYHGRVDHQVQLRGFRIELGEVQAMLAGHPDVANAVVAVADPDTTNQRLVGYVVLRSGETTERALHDWLSCELPEHMVPSTFVVLERMPLTVNGKVDRSALPPAGRRPRTTDEPYVAPRDDIERYLVREWEEILQIDGIGINDRFFELGGTSLQAAEFINRLQRRLEVPIFGITIFSAPSVMRYARFLLDEYPAAVAKLFGVQGDPTTRARTEPRAPERVTQVLLDEFRQLIPPLSKGSSRGAETDELDPAVFILAPPRSGTTLLRVMLAGHPQLFAAAELLLLGFNTLQDRRQAYSDRFSLWREGLLRTLMDIHSCSPGDAERIMQQAEDEGVTTKEFYRRIQQRIAPRTLVDKSPSYALLGSTLRAAESHFRDPLYIHLLRDPRAMVHSFAKSRMDQVLYLKPHRFDPRTLGEILWTISHQNILAFLQEVPAHRQHTLRFEDLVTGPEEAMRGLCERLGLSFHEQLIHPYHDVGSKMVDGLHPESTPMGDPSFLSHGAIRSDIAYSWRQESSAESLGDVTRELAEQLGYGQISQTPSPRQRDQHLLLQQQARRISRGAEVRDEFTKEGGA